MSTIQVDIVSAEGEIFSGTAEMAICPAIQGDVGVTPKHTPLLTKLRAGEVRVQNGGKDQETIFVTGGILEIQPNQVTVLADTAMRADDIDEAAAQEAKQRAEEAVANQQSNAEVGTAQAELAIAIARLRVLESYRKRKGAR
jgi:F-type H+-transporting ATPase subunit epsilon